ncbi:BQ5605_C023g09626 [Microbotryum silenes-dioicae]|uniref:BQ5605_C023g09626 protein n=1 Tax=Microbotryum silenes-dioicae TaxID=796604 RepID=A0A2X0ML60_9BASI|nr:BQ5605_C023g09626 [Microbotryum silenes-dioicae]
MDHSYSAGGGFMRGSQGGAASSPGDGGSKRNGPSSLRPVTIHQILNASQAHPDADLFIDEKEAKDITFVACVRNVNSSATHLGYLVEDGTGAYNNLVERTPRVCGFSAHTFDVLISGQIDVRRWIDGDVEAAANEFEINTYVRILGTIKVFHNKRSIHCTRMRLVEDKNEVLYHAIECVHASLFLTRGPPGKANGAAGYVIPNQAGGQYDASNPYEGAANGVGAGGDPFADFPPVQRKLMQFIRDTIPQAPEGVNIQHIARSAGVPHDQAIQQLGLLQEEGHLYSTFDDNQSVFKLSEVAAKSSDKRVC